MLLFLIAIAIYQNQRAKNKGDNTKYGNITSNLSFSMSTSVEV
jgi:hypothetical protein